MKLVFLVGSISDSHIIRRAQSLKEAGYDVEICGFKRDVKSNNKIEGIPVRILGQIEDQHYLKRINKEWKAVSLAIDSYSKDTLFYVWGFDLALFAYLKKALYVYEISDIRYGEFGRIIGAFFKSIDKRLINKSVVTVITSEGFVEYLGIEKNKKVILMPNRLSQIFCEIERPKPRCIDGKIKFGFVGYYRYPKTVLRLARLVGEHANRFEFHFWGTGPDSMLNEINKLCNYYNNVFEHGPFKNPDDLSFIYSNIDIIACNYDVHGVNERIAEPNKLYESIYFNKPLVVSSRTFLGKKVERLGCGYVIDSHNEENITAFLEGISKEELSEKSNNESQIPERELVEDYAQLLCRINL